MKIKNFFLFITFTSILIIGCGKTIKPLEDPNNKIALIEIKKEPKIKDATITDDNVLYVSVEDDGTVRNGYAEYLCQVLREYNATTNWVKVVKVNSSKDFNSNNNHEVLLGEAHCK